jgi:hypothetical protein
MASPDLSVKFGNILSTPTIFPDEQGKLQVIVTNQGNAQTKGPISLNLYASTDAALDDAPLNTLNDALEGTDELLGSRSIRNLNLAPGASQTVTVDFASSAFRTPSVVSPGAYYLIAEVDPNNTITESNETNNGANQFISTDGTDVVLDWNATLLNAIQAVASRPETSPPFGVRNQAIVHAAIYDAVNAIDRSHKPYLVNIDASDPLIAGASAEAAAVEAAYQTLVNLYPTEKAAFDEQRTRSLAEIPDGTAENKGVALGKFVADRILALRSTDGAIRADKVPYTPGTDPGDYQLLPGQTPLLPGWRRVTPFAIDSVSEFRPDGPPEFGSPQYGREIEEVRLLGGLENTDVTTITRTEDQTEIAKFWAYDREDTFRPPGQWNEIAQEVALEQGNTLAENARLFALLNIAEADAGIVGWDAKYTFNQLRPITAIQNADNDGNSITTQDPDWESLLATPPFPDYVSGHSVFGGAAAQILARFFDNNNDNIDNDISFSIPSQELPGVSRSFSSFTQAAQENADSRLFGGVHVDLATVDGVAIGKDVGNFVFDNFLV